MTLWKQKKFVISPFVEIISKVEYNVDYELMRLVKTSYNDLAELFELIICVDALLQSSYEMGFSHYILAFPTGSKELFGIEKNIVLNHSIYMEGIQV